MATVSDVGSGSHSAESCNQAGNEALAVGKHGVAVQVRCRRPAVSSLLARTDGQEEGIARIKSLVISL
jgi:hypothetical protein